MSVFSEDCLFWILAFSAGAATGGTWPLACTFTERALLFRTIGLSQDTLPAALGTIDSALSLAAGAFHIPSHAIDGSS
jgi:hypothetical protein